MYYAGGMTLPSSDAPQLWVLAEHLHNLSRTISRVLPATSGLEPLPASELAAILKIQGEPGQSVTALAAQLGMRQSNTSAVVRDLVGRGLVRREKSPTDQRAVLLYPTELALRNNQIVEESWSATLGAAVLRLSPEQRGAILGAAEALGTLEEELRAG
jgi:DNA-binding MarR family transcriptional regulator